MILDQDTGGRSVTAQSNLNSFSDDEDTREMLLGARTTNAGRKASGFTRPSKDATDVAKTGTSRRGRGRGTASMKQTTLNFSQSRLLNYLLPCIYTITVQPMPKWNSHGTV